MDFDSRCTLLELFAEITSSAEHCMSFEGIHLPQVGSTRGQEGWEWGARAGALVQDKRVVEGGQVSRTGCWESWHRTWAWGEAGGGAEAPGEPWLQAGRGGWAERSLLLPAGLELSWEPAWE